MKDLQFVYMRCTSGAVRAGHVSARAMRPAMHACTTIDTHQANIMNEGHAMTDWSLLDQEWPPDRPHDPYIYGMNYFPEKPVPQYFPPQAQHYNMPPSPTLTLLLSPPLQHSPTLLAPNHTDYLIPKGENPREIRNKAEKQRRDKLNHSISELASMVPPVVAANRKIDKTGVLRLTAHYLRAHQYVFGESIESTDGPGFNAVSTQAVLGLLKGFLLTTTYKGIVVVISQNVQQYLGYTELDLLGQNILNITHPDDRQMLRELLMPRTQKLGSHGELLIPDEPDGKEKVAEALAKEKRKFNIRFKKLSQRSEPAQYVSCIVEGSLRKSDRACRGYNRCCQMVRRARARGDNPYSSGNDIVFIGVVRPTAETFMTESTLESFKMEYRTRHSIDGEIIQCEHRIALVTGYMTHEVNGMNAMNFMHRDDVRWVIIALREMYVQHRLFGESCYRLMTKNGQFIYMKTRGRLDVDKDSRAVRSFVCTNTVVEEQEGKQLIKQMRKKFTLQVNNNEESIPALRDDEPTDVIDSPDNQFIPVEDPRHLEKVILNLVTNLPSTIPEDSRIVTPERGESSILPLSIIPPKKEKIVSAIEKIYGVIKNFSKESSNEMERNKEKLENILESPNQETEQDNGLAPPSLPPEDVMPGPMSLPSLLEPHQQLPPPIEPGSSNLRPSTLLTRDRGEPSYYGTSNRRRRQSNRRGFESTFRRPLSSVPTPLNSPSVSMPYGVFNVSGGEVIDENFSPTLIDQGDINNPDITIRLPVIDMSARTQPNYVVTSTVTPIGSDCIGSKRQNNSHDHESPKKKQQPARETATHDETHAEQWDVNPVFDRLLQATIQGDNSQVDSSLLNTLEQGTFPDLLISEEVQNILNQIEGQEEENPKNTN